MTAPRKEKRSLGDTVFYALLAAFTAGWTCGVALAWAVIAGGGP
jgi:hypothetical protein